MASAFVFLPSSIAADSASLFSGLGDLTELKFGSKLFCVFTTLTSTPWSKSEGTAEIAPVP